MVYIRTYITLLFVDLYLFGKNSNQKEIVDLLEDEEEEIVDSGDRDIHIGVSSTVLEHPVGIPQ